MIDISDILSLVSLHKCMMLPFSFPITFIIFVFSDFFSFDHHLRLFLITFQLIIFQTHLIKDVLSPDTTSQRKPIQTHIHTYAEVLKSENRFTRPINNNTDTLRYKYFYILVQSAFCSLSHATSVGHPVHCYWSAIAKCLTTSKNSFVPNLNDTQIKTKLFPNTLLFHLLFPNPRQ